MSRRTLRPRPFDNKKKLTVVHEATGLDLEGSTVERSIANRNRELEKNNDKVNEGWKWESSRQCGDRW